MAKFVSFMVCLLLIGACRSSKPHKPNEKFAEQMEGSIWKDSLAPDTKPFYPSSAACEKLGGRYEYISVLHKGFLDDKEVFQGMILTNNMLITADTVYYLSMYNQVLDYGAYQCSNGKMQIEWNEIFHRSIEYDVHFRSKDTLELRYLDFPKTIDYYFDKDTSGFFKKGANTPSKILLRKVEG